MYLTREDIISALKEIKSFENDLNEVYAHRGYNFRENTGRRNALISIAQEREVAKILRRKFKDVIEDGSPGKPDIYIKDIQTELECKLTSGSKSKGSRVYSLQTDWETLCQKESLDYLYIIANKEFDQFCVLHFESLTPDDFFPPANGSRGKSRMNKTNAMRKVKCLVGDYTVHNEVYLNKIHLETMDEFNSYQVKMRDLWKVYEGINPDNVNKIKEVKNEKNKLTSAHRKKVKTLSGRAKYWQTSPKRFRFIFEQV